MQNFKLKELLKVYKDARAQENGIFNFLKSDEPLCIQLEALCSSITFFDSGEIRDSRIITVFLNNLPSNPDIHFNQFFHTTLDLMNATLEKKLTGLSVSGNAVAIKETLLLLRDKGPQHQTPVNIDALIFYVTSANAEALQQFIVPYLEQKEPINLYPLLALNTIDPALVTQPLLLERLNSTGRFWEMVRAIKKFHSKNMPSHLFELCMTLLNDSIIERFSRAICETIDAIIRWADDNQQAYGPHLISFFQPERIKLIATACEPIYFASALFMLFEKNITLEDYPEFSNSLHNWGRPDYAAQDFIRLKQRELISPQEKCYLNLYIANPCTDVYQLLCLLDDNKLLETNRDKLTQCKNIRALAKEFQQLTSSEGNRGYFEVNRKKVITQVDFDACFSRVSPAEARLNIAAPSM